MTTVETVFISSRALVIATFLKALVPRPKLVKLFLKPVATVNNPAITILAGTGRIVTSLVRIETIIMLKT